MDNFLYFYIFDFKTQCSTKNCSFLRGMDGKSITRTACCFQKYMKQTYTEYLVRFTICHTQYLLVKMTTGHQSLYDTVLRDYLLLAIFSSNIFSLALVISTFQLLLADKPIIANCLMIIHNAAFVSMNFHGGCLTIVRMVCMINMRFMEDTLGEKLVKNLSLGISFAAAITSSCVQILNNDMNTGQIYFLITKQTVAAGKILFPCCNAD